MNEKLQRQIEAMKRLHPGTKFTIKEAPTAEISAVDQPTGNKRKADEARAMIRRQFGMPD